MCVIYYINTDFRYIGRKSSCFWKENEFAEQCHCVPWKGLQMVSENFHGWSLKPQSAGKKLKYRPKPDFSICVKNDGCLKSMNVKHLPVCRRNVLLEQVHELMTCTQMIGTTEFVTRQHF